MKITKKIEAEILQVIEDYWDSYFQGDLQSWAAYLPEDYRNIGTTKAEIWNSKKEIVDFTESIIDQTVGMAEVRDKKTQIIPYDPYVMVHELGDLYVKAEEGWVYYAQFRLSSLLENTSEGWKILHQHGSYPDSKTDEGEAFGFDELKAENKKLRDAIQSRTIELERKNRELEIESALERVRAVAMSMKNSKELQAVGEVIFKELITLGFSDLRNTEIIINQDEKQSILSYYYSDYGVSGQIEVDYTSHPVLKKWADDMKTAGDGFASVHISEKEMEGWKQYRLDLGYLPDPKLENAKTLDYYSYSTGLGALSISSFEPISEEQLTLLERFRNVFGLAYRRYADVVQAERQAREARIEAALERVRARSLAMHHTSELQDVINTVHQQFLSLNIEITGGVFISINKDIEEQNKIICWGAGGTADYVQEVSLPFIDWPIYTKLLEGIKQGPGFFTEAFSNEEKIEFFKYLFKHPPYSAAPPKRKKEVLSRSGGYTRSCMVSEHTSIFMINHHGRKFTTAENDILKRFGIVFEQAYTRFLDLQKAEAQAREAQIEAALEKVRSRSLAVNKSDEFNEVVGVVFEKLSELDMPVGSVTIALTKADTKDWEVYGCGEGESGLALIKFTLPYFPNAFSDDILAAQSSNDSGYFSKVYSEAQKNEYYEFAFKNTELKNLPEDLKQIVWQSTSYGLSVAYTKNSILMVNEFEGKVLDDDQANILNRFSKVFEQTYIRFLDLQRAEAQAREAEIQLALERVRARTMAMQHSDELKAASGVLIQQVLSLGIPAFSCGYNIFEKDAAECTAWMSTPDGGINPAINIPLTEDPNFIRFAESKKQGEEFYVLEMRGADMQRHYQYLSDTIPVFEETFNAIRTSGQSLPPTQIHHLVNFTYGNLMFITLEPCPDAHDTFKRFGKVFEQTYTRFLDLQRAELQAKEAQIEAALERVRSRSMAMHQSEELNEVVSELYQQIQSLEFSDYGCTIIICKAESKTLEHWYAGEDQVLSGQCYNVPLTDQPVSQKQWTSWLEEVPEFKIYLSGQEKADYTEFMLTKTDHKYFSDDVKEEWRAPDEIYFYYARMRFGLLEFVNIEPFDEVNFPVYQRFAKVFEQAYTRFLDLQKAEAQAREAQIEVSLERIRAASLAMHNSEELSEVGRVFLNQIEHLAIPLFGIAILVVNEDTHNVVQYMVDNTKKGQEPTLLVFEYKIEDFSVAVEGIELLKKGKTEYTISGGKKKITQWVAWVKKYMGPERAERLEQANLGKVFFHTIHFHGLSNINFTSLENLSAEKWSVMRRLVATFARSYRRFLDLQKAEAQAREAQVEAALERVRARAMAMHVSSELSEVVAYLYRELNQFEMGDWGCNIMIFNEEKDQIEIWLAESDQRVFDDSFKYRTKGHVFIEQQWNIWRKQRDENVSLSGKIKRSYDDYILKNTDFKNLPAAIKAQIRSLEEIHFSFATMQYGMLAVIDSNKGLSESEKAILKRFAKVFQQTYTRFLDLQKAEAQAQEAQIEVALERVRAQTMAMHQSDELRLVTATVFEQLRELGFDIPLCGFIIYDKESGDSKHLLSGFGSNIFPEAYHVPRFDHPYLNAQWNDWKEGESFKGYVWEGALKQSVDEYYFKHTDFKKFPPEIKKQFKRTDHIIIYDAFMSHGALEINSAKPISEKQKEIQQRFARVFEQTYTRFLDLQKAEAQAREAQMETTLERIRAASMAMQHSDELPNMALQFLTQLELQDVPIIGATINVVDEEKQTAVSYFADNTKEKDPQLLSTIEYEIKNYWAPRKVTGEINKGTNELTIEAKGKQIKNWIKWIKETLSVERAARLEKAGFKKVFFHSIQIHNSSSLTLSSLLPLNEEHWTTVRRMAKTFVLSYQRFIDLQKAEAQAREAQIEAALERVRAASMAMHKSSELPDVALVLVNQLAELNIQQLGSSILMLDGATETYSQFSAHDDLNGQKKILNIVQDRKMPPNAFLGREIFRLAKAGEKDFCIPLKGKDLKEFIQDMTDHVHQERGQAMRQANFECVYFYFSVYHGISPIVITTLEPLPDSKLAVLQRMANTFGMSYRRFLDLQKAEAQAREAEIEAALERVRSATMAMHQSSELHQAAGVLFEQLSLLGAELFTCGFVLCEEDNPLDEQWMYARNTGKFVTQYIPHEEERVHFNLYKAWKAGTPLYSEAVEGQELEEIIKFLMAQPSVQKNISQLISEGIEIPKFQKLHGATFSKGYLLIITTSHFPEEEIFIRFAKVFEQTYTRFLDLQRAEEQAREAEIEAALERVRAQTMAMHNSEDVGKSIVKMFEELTALGVPESTRFGIGILNHDNTNNQLWTAKKIGEEVSMHIGNLDMTLHPLLKSARKAWEKQVPLHKYILEGEDLLNYYRMLNDAPDYELKVAMDKLPEREIHYGFVFDHGFFYAFSPREFETELIRITQRFSSLFAQTYRRYLDLVKAEAQAREAEIELALERVRAKTMAMHNSEELLETGAILFKELSKLGIKIFNCGYVLMDDEAKMGWNYGVNPGDGTIRTLPTGIPQSGTKVLDAITENWKKQEPLLVIELNPQETIEHQTYIAENAPNFSLTKDQLLALTPEQLVIQTFNFKYGYLLLVDGVKLTTDQREMVMRFANVFEMTYRRFLDLQKAEAQAREAQIEAAVERVRAEAMAMHSSEDFNQTAAVLWEQVNKLEVTGFAGAGIALFGEDGYITWYDFSSPGNIGSHEGNVNRYEYGKYPLLGKEVREVYQQGEPYFVFEYDLPKLKAAVKEWELIKPSVAEGFKEAIDSGQLTHQWGACGRITNGFLFFDQLLPPDEDSRNILLKMTGAFELAYQRFIDLQKAEAQAREKEIQLGLEKVRARAMAMRHSDELADLVKAVFDELTKLDFAMQWCMINIIDEATRDNTIWAVNPDVDKAPQSYDIRFGDWPYHQASFKAYQERKTKFVYVLEGKEKEEFEEFMFNETDVANISDEAKAATRAMERYVHSYSFSDFGGLQTVSETPLSEESLDILARFGKVFDLTYTRFNDLKLAEAQAREAQIEAALERVRSRSLAMHKTEELGEVVTVVVEKLKELDISVEDGVALITYLEDSKDLMEWMENPGFPAAMKFHLPYFEHPVLIDLWKAKEEGADFLAAKYNLEESQSFLNHIFEYSDFKHTPQEIKDYCLNAETYGYSIAYQENTSIFVNHYSGQSLSESEVSILKRFSKVFEQAYTRFLDLQRAEAQARESQIEAAMERVRARAMAMQKADELVDVATLLRKEMGLLGVEELETSSIYIHNKTTGKTECWYAIQDNEKEENLISDHMHIDLNDTWVGRQMLQFYQSDETKTSILMQGSNRTEWINYCAQHSDLFSVAEFYGAEVPERTYHLYKFSNGYMGAASPGAISDESWNLLQRATKVFSLAYTRFSDLQMAEAQAREAQIELALERGRTQSMLMQHSDELSDVSNVFHEQLLLLGLPSEFSYVWLPDEEKMTHMFWATWSEKSNKGIISRSKSYTYPLDKEEPYTAACYEMWESEESVFVNRIQANEVEDFFSTWAELVSEAETLKAELFPDGLYYAEAYMKYGCFGINIRRSLSKEEQDILLRFSVEFERAYTRFLDLKKAEAQTREAQIEASLERVRAQTMAMHDSEDVGQCIVKLFSELITLGVSENTRLGIGILNHDNENMELWTASKDNDDEVNLSSGNIDMSRHPLLVSARNAWKEKRRVDQYIIDGKEQVKAYFQIINTMPDYPVSVNMKKVADRIVHYDFSFEQGILYAFSLQELSEEMIHIFQRFSALFGQTYRRFLDLKKAEAQAREAKIEAALERVRSRTMAMHKAEELHEVVTVVVEKLVDLGVVLDANGVILCTYFKDSRDVLHWIASPDFSFSGSYLLPYFDHPIFSAAWESKLNGDDYFSKSFTVEEKNTFFEYAFEHSDYKHFPEEFKEWVFQNDKHSLSFAWSENSAILIPSHTGVLPSNEDAEILKRFAKVFEQAYVRFMDLQKAEKQAKEALKQAALDRVRGEIASMRSTKDLNRITPVIWRELIALDVPFIRCGVFIVNEEAKVVEVYLTTPEGAALGVLNLPFDINSQTTNTVKYWREKKVYREHWDAQTFTDWTQSMIDLGQVKDFSDYQGATKIPEELHLHFIPFKQGMLYVGDVNPLPDGKIEMVKTLAEAFSIAYARYEDFVRLEQAKSAVEVTLEELKSTQAQLIQSEKMASLGELTAGIAHEIQNPLNFVNNFSEVSDEILDEMIEEIEKGDLEEVKAIAADIKQNLQKINHHGKRADAIVKGMLQHSRKSSGEKTPTDINLLADEYLRLAYHGLRAKDKSFNAAFETHFDPDLPMIKVIPQDVGRVLLNLINNAFQAVQEKRISAADDYAPKISVHTSKIPATKSVEEGVLIKIQDNGPGIPDRIRDKIFQPFFTTKPTGEGTGLGLSLSYDIIKAHGGVLEIDTTEGAGTTFSILIPDKV